MMSDLFGSAFGDGIGLKSGIRHNRKSLWRDLFEKPLGQIDQPPARDSPPTSSPTETLQAATTPSKGADTVVLLRLISALSLA